MDGPSAEGSGRPRGGGAVLHSARTPECPSGGRVSAGTGCPPGPRPPPQTGLSSVYVIHLSLEGHLETTFMTENKTTSHHLNALEPPCPFTLCAQVCAHHHQGRPQGNLDTPLVSRGD